MYGFIKVFRTVFLDGDVEHGATSDSEMNELGQVTVAEKTNELINIPDNIGYE